MYEIPVFQGLSISVVLSPDKQLATLSVMGAKPIMIHLPAGALAHLQKQINALLPPSPPQAPQG